MKFRYGKKCNCGRCVTCNIFDCPDAKYDPQVYPMKVKDDKTIIQPKYKEEIKAAVGLLKEYMTESNKGQQLYEFGEMCYIKGRDEAINDMIELARKSKKYTTCAQKQ